MFYVKKDGFFINGLNALASVNSEQDVKINLKFHNWQDQIISNFKKNNSQKHTFNWAGKKDDLLQSFFISDGYFLTEDKKSQINIIAPKNWNKDFINKVIKYLSKITIKCNKFFTAQDHAFLPTNNSFILIEQENSLFGTEGVAQQGSNFSYQVIASSDLYNNNFTNELKHTLIHEYLHQWIGLKLKAEVPQDSRWFFEGAVDYYSAKLGYISGFYDSDGFFKFYNNNLREYYAYNFDKAEISEMTRQTPIYDLLEYKIGFLLSSIIDNELSKMNPKYNLDFFIKNIVNEEKNFDLKEFFKKNKIYYKY